MSEPQVLESERRVPGREGQGRGREACRGVGRGERGGKYFKEDIWTKVINSVSRWEVT